MAGDNATPGEGAPGEDAQQPPAKPRGFDIRVLIAGLLGLYGVVLTILGITDGQEALEKAEGLRVNLWIGIGLLVVAAFFGAWARLAPQRAEGEQPSASPQTPPN